MVSILKNFYDVLLGRHDEPMFIGRGEKRRTKKEKLFQISVVREESEWELHRSRNEVNRLIDEVNRFELERSDLLSRVQKQKRLIEEMIYASGGYLWRKDADGSFTWCDKTFCKDFFDIDVESCHVEGLSYDDLARNHKSRTGKKNTFSEICRKTDSHVLSKKTKQRYIEIGYIGEELKVLDIIKTPLLRGDEGGIIGFLIDRTEYCEAVLQMVNEGRKEGYIKKIFDSGDGLAKAFHVTPPEGNRSSFCYDFMGSTCQFMSHGIDAEAGLNG